MFKLFVQASSPNAGPVSILTIDFDTRLEADYAATILTDSPVITCKRTITKLYPPAPEIYTASVRDLKLSERATNCLFGHGIHTVEDLCAMTRAELEGLYNFGKVSLAEVDTFLVRNKLHLAG